MKASCFKSDNQKQICRETHRRAWKIARGELSISCDMQIPSILPGELFRALQTQLNLDMFSSRKVSTPMHSTMALQGEFIKPQIDISAQWINIKWSKLSFKSKS